jgi:hypothetical protein
MGGCCWAGGGCIAGEGCDPDNPDDGGADGCGADGCGAGAAGTDGPGGGISPCGREAGALRDADGGGSGIECGWLGRSCDGRIVDSCGATGLDGGVMGASGDQTPGPCGAGGTEDTGGTEGAEGSNNGDGGSA